MSLPIIGVPSSQRPALSLPAGLGNVTAVISSRRSGTVSMSGVSSGRRRLVAQMTRRSCEQRTREEAEEIGTIRDELGARDARGRRCRE